MDKIKFAKVKKFLRGKSFAGALCLSVAAVGIAAYIAYDSALSDISSQESRTPDTSVQAVDNTVSGIAKDNAASSDTAADAQTADSGAEQANNFVHSTAERMMPIDGDIEIINQYSNGELVKSETLGVWKTHDGIDLAAPLGTEVKAATSGKVISVKDDPLWGVCVVIDHNDGYEGYYYGLDKALEVSEQTEVEAGQIIGKTAEFDCESKLAPHLHFGVKKNGEWINPVSDFIEA